MSDMMQGVRMPLPNRLGAARYRFWTWTLRQALKRHPGAVNSNLVAHADEELRRAGWADKDGFYGGMMYDAVMSAIRLFSIEGHSGMSASIAASVIEKVSRFQPLTPITADPSEWGEPFDEEGTRQCRRMSSLFMRPDGTVYWLDGRIFEEPDGCRFTSSDSRVDVDLPWTPTEPEIVKVQAHA